MDSESNTTNSPLTDKDIVVEGGADERSTKSTLKKRSKTPEDVKDFYGSKFNELDLINRITSQVERKRFNQKPKPLSSLDVTITPTSINGRTFARCNISFIQNSDPNFAGARVYVKGYGTDNAMGDNPDGQIDTDSFPFQQVALIQKSPSTILLEASSEDIIFAVEAINSEGVGSGIDTMPTLTTTLI